MNLVSLNNIANMSFFKNHLEVRRMILWQLNLLNKPPKKKNLTTEKRKGERRNEGIEADQLKVRHIN